MTIAESAADAGRKVKNPLVSVIFIGVLTGLVQYEINIGPVMSISVARNLDMASSMQSFVTGIVPLALAATIIAAGSLADRLGRRRVLAAGIAISILGDIVTVMASSGLMFAAGRAIVGVGGAAVYVCAFGLVREVAPTPKQLGQYLGLWVMALYMTLLVMNLTGSLLGGSNWRFSYAIAPVIYLGCLLLLFSLLPETPTFSDGSFDFPGLSILGIGMVGVLYGLTQAGLAPLAAGTLIPLLAGVACLVGFYFIEKVRKYPAFPVELFKNRYFVAALVAGIAFNGFEAVFLIQTSMEWQYLFRYEPIIVALGQLPVAIAVIATSAWFGRMMSRGRSNQSIIIGGLLTMSAAFVILTFTPLFAPMGLFILTGVLVGVGTSAAQTAQAKLFMDQAPPKYFTATLASRTAVGQLGYSIGIAASSALLLGSFNRKIDSEVAGLSNEDIARVKQLIIDFINDGLVPVNAEGLQTLHRAQTIFNDSFRLVMLISLIMTVLSALAVHLLMRRPPRALVDDAVGLEARAAS